MKQIRILSFISTLNTGALVAVCAGLDTPTLGIVIYILVNGTFMVVSQVISLLDALDGA